LRDMHRNMDSTSCVCVKQRESEKFFRLCSQLQSPSVPSADTQGKC
jgi:hypothetical protein